MDYSQSPSSGQLPASPGFLLMPSGLGGFEAGAPRVMRARSGREVFLYEGSVPVGEGERACSCGRRMHVNGYSELTLRHLPFGESLTSVRLPHAQLRCQGCSATKMQRIPFRAEGHMVTEPLRQYVRDLLASGSLTNKEVAEITGLGQNAVKEIDKERLLEKYAEGGSLAMPESPSEYLAIDEFKLHDGHRYATHIIDLRTGHVLWIAAGKGKQIVYDFIKRVGDAWMRGVVAVACDMNSDFQEAFQDSCPWIRVVYDHFHIVKNFNDGVVSAVRKDEQARLLKSGDAKAARALKRSRFILWSSRETLRRADEAEGKTVRKGAGIFGGPEAKGKGGRVARYEALLKENSLLMTVEIVRDMLSEAYASRDEAEMADMVSRIVGVCHASGNKHFKWFARLLESHFDGVIAHATFAISTGMIEGTNQKIKTIRRQAYGIPDDEYFFLKIMDASRAEYIRNPKSHKILD